MLSTGPTLQHDNSLSRRFICLSYTERDGVLRAFASSEVCTGTQLSSTANQDNYFNITSSGPCLQALTGAAAATTSSLLPLIALLSSLLLRLA